MTNWHVDAGQAQSYANGTSEPALAASIDAHVPLCPQCQGELAGAVPAARMDAVWDAVIDRIDAPTVGVVERLLARVGMTDSDARLVMSTRAQQLPWIVALCTALLFSVFAAGQRGIGPNLFLLLAPVLPVIGVGAAFGRRTDPTYELAQAAPYSSLRLLLLRTASVLVVTIVPAAMLGALLPDRGTAIVWLLPALALVTATLALAAWLPLPIAAGIVAIAWITVLAVFWAAGSSLSTAFGTGGQVAALLVVAIAAFATANAIRIHAYDIRSF